MIKDQTYEMFYNTNYLFCLEYTDGSFRIRVWQLYL